MAVGGHRVGVEHPIAAAASAAGSTGGDHTGGDGVGVMAIRRNRDVSLQIGEAKAGLYVTGVD